MDGRPSDALRATVDLMQRLLPLAGIIGAVTYGVMYIAYVQFYGQFGVSLDEVGIGKAELLSEAVVGPMTGALLIATVVVAVRLLFEAALHLYRRASAFTWPNAALAVTAFVSGLMLMLGQTVYVSNRSATNARTKGHGIEARYWFLPGNFGLPMVNVQALPVELTYKPGSAVPPRLRPGAKCVFYLGQSAGVVVLYDTEQRRTIRMPASDVTTDVQLGIQERGLGHEPRGRIDLPASCRFAPE